jgi:hypothetical protein
LPKRLPLTDPQEPCAAVDAARRDRLAQADTNGCTLDSGIKQRFLEMFSNLHIIDKWA